MYTMLSILMLMCNWAGHTFAFFVLIRNCTVLPRTSEESKEFIKCRLENFSMGFILLRGF